MSCGEEWQFSNLGPGFFSLIQKHCGGYLYVNAGQALNFNNFFRI